MEVREETNMLAIGMAVAVMNLNTIIKKYERGENMQSLYFLFLKKCTKMMKSLFFFFIITISLFLSGGIFKKKWNIQVNIHQNEVINNNFLNKSRTLSTYFFFFENIWLNLYLEAVVVIHLESKESPNFIPKTPYGFILGTSFLASKYGV